MKVNGTPTRTIWLAADGAAVEIIDQTRLPHHFEVARLETLDDAARAIKDMLVRGAPLIGATAAHGLALAMRQDASDAGPGAAYDRLFATRPTAVNLRWALDDLRGRLAPLAPAERVGGGACAGRSRSATRTWPCARPSASTAMPCSVPCGKRRAGRSASTC